jgi:acyl-coenzyme A synthetase/AMP-(fatty) acid ligase
MPRFSTIQELLAAGRGEDIAFAASGCPPLSYNDLRAHVERTVAGLNRLGIGRNDRVALVLPNGTEMATAFVAVAAGATAAPPGRRWASWARMAACSARA